jgi:hypothetical protein
VTNDRHAELLDALQRADRAIADLPSRADDRAVRSVATSRGRHPRGPTSARCSSLEATFTVTPTSFPVDHAVTDGARMIQVTDRNTKSIMQQPASPPSLRMERLGNTAS